MKRIKLFIMAISLIAFLSCSTNYTPTLDDDTNFDGETRTDSTKNDTTNNGGIDGEIHDWDNGGVEDIIATED